MTRKQMKYQVHAVDGSGVPIKTFCFSSKRACKEWLLEGVMGTEGSEQSRFCEALDCLESGKTVMTL